MESNDMFSSIRKPLKLGRNGTLESSLFPTPSKLPGRHLKPIDIFRTSPWQDSWRLDPRADIVIHPEITAGRIDERIPRPELRQCDPCRRVDRVTAVPRFHLVEGLAVAHDSGHLGAWARGLRRGIGRGGGRGVYAHVVIQPEVGAGWCGGGLAGALKVGRWYHIGEWGSGLTSVNRRVHCHELRFCDAVLGCDGTALISGDDLMELVAIAWDTGLSWAWRRWGRSG